MHALMEDHHDGGDPRVESDPALGLAVVLPSGLEKHTTVHGR